MSEFKQAVPLTKEQQHAMEMIASMGMVKLECRVIGSEFWYDFICPPDFRVPFDFVNYEYRVKKRQPKPLEPILIKVSTDNTPYIRWILGLFVKLNDDGSIVYKHAVSALGEMSISEPVKCTWKYVLLEE
jgi:hypothetical protein